MAVSLICWCLVVQKKFIVSITCVLIALSVGWYFYTAPSQAPTQNTTKSEGTVYERSYSPNIGPKNAKVTISEFFDPACEACRAFYPIVKDILARHPNDVRLVLRYATFHQGSDTVVRMLEAARLQNTFTPVLEALLSGQSEWASHGSPNISRAWEIARSAGLDLDKAKAVMGSEEFDNMLQLEKEDIRTLKVVQTPTFFVNGKPLPSFGVQQLYDLVLSEIKNPT
jgi:protein-disulfide isomerase